MHPELDKTKLLDTIRLEYAFFERTLAQVPPERFAEAGVDGKFSVKDIVAHLTAWERRLLGWLAQAKRSEAPSFPEPGYTSADTDILNERTYQEDKDRALDDILADFHTTQAEVLRCIDSFPEEDLLELHRLKGIWREPPLALIVGNTSDHYREHAAAIRRWLNSL